MKNIKLLSLLLASFLVLGCGSGKTNYTKNEDLKEMKKMGFDETDYSDTNNYFYAISSTRGAGSKSGITTLTREKCKAALVSKIESYMASENNIDMSGQDGGTFTESMKAKIRVTTSSAVNSMKLVDSKWYDAGRNEDGAQKYEYWAVYSVEKQNIN